MLLIFQIDFPWQIDGTVDRVAKRLAECVCVHVTCMSVNMIQGNKSWTMFKKNEDGVVTIKYYPLINKRTCKVENSKIMFN